MEDPNLAPHWIFLSTVSAQKFGPAKFPEPGKTVCLSGKESKVVSCGPVAGEPEESWYEDLERGVTGRLWLVPVNMRSIKGDSGSPVWDPYTGEAVGIVSGGPEGNNDVTKIQPLMAWPGHETVAPGGLNMPEMAPLRVLCWQGPPC
jgi:hypothetical protein